MVPAVGVRGYQLYAELGVRGFRGRRIVGGCVCFDDLAATVVKPLESFVRLCELLLEIAQLEDGLSAIRSAVHYKAKQPRLGQHRFVLR